MLSQFIDLDAQVDSDGELSEDEGEFLGNDTQIPSSSTLPTSSQPNFDEIIAHIEEKYLEHIEDKYLNFTTAVAHNPSIPLRLQTLKDDDWCLWRVKCTPRQEYFLLFELMLKHEILSDELRAVFYNPRDVGYLYLEAQFSKQGSRSLQQVLRGFMDVRMSSLAIVPASDVRKCLTIPASSLDQVMVAGQWVQINRGLYEGDVGVVVSQFRDDDSVNAVEVKVVPRLNFSSTSSSLKRKRGPGVRPPPQLFDPRTCNSQLLAQETNAPIYTYKSYRFEYGLQVKYYNPSSLSRAREIPANICHLFMRSKELAGPEFDLFSMGSMPIPSFWHFEPGEHVLVHSNKEVLKGVISDSLLEASLAQSSCVVNFGAQGEHRIPIADITKDIILGDYIEVLVGTHAGEKGFVIARADVLLGICVGRRTNGLDFQAHVNSVKITEPEYFNTEMPWLNIAVKLTSPPFQTGLVKHVAVTSQRSLAITVDLDGSTCVVGYSQLRELHSGKLLLDYQPLKKHQQQFDVEVPWKEIKVVIKAGRFSGYEGIVKNVRQDFRGSPRLSLWISLFSCSIEIDHSAVVEARTKLPLLEYRPLEGNQLSEFKPNPALQEMRTGPCPWLGMLVDIVKGEFKGQYGAVKDVNRYETDSRRAEPQSGLLLTVERYVFTATSSAIVKVDYSMVRYHRTSLYLCDVFMPTPRQSFFIPNEVMRQVRPAQNKDTKAAPSQSEHEITRSEGGKTPLPNDFERETLFTGVWSPGHRTPMYSLPPNPSGRSSPIPRTPASPSLTSPVSLANDTSPQPTSVFEGHWILHPKLVGIPIQVDINGGEFDTTNKKTGVFVETVADECGSISVTYRRSPNRVVNIPFNAVVISRQRPKPSTEKGLMVVTRNHPQHIGKLVRQVHHFYENQRIEDNHFLVLVTVERHNGQERRATEFLQLHANDLDYVKETSDERKHAKEYLNDLRTEFAALGVCVRAKSDLPALFLL